MKELIFIFKMIQYQYTYRTYNLSFLRCLLEIFNHDNMTPKIGNLLNWPLISHKQSDKYNFYFHITNRFRLSQVNFASYQPKNADSSHLYYDSCFIFHTRIFIQNKTSLVPGTSVKPNCSF